MVATLALVLLDKDDEQVYRKVVGSVVQIETSDSTTDDPSFSGTGFYCTFSSAKGFVTAKHVVNTAKKIVVVIKNKRIVCEAWLSPTADYAVLKPKTSIHLTALKLQTKAPVVGQSCWVVGHPSPGDVTYFNVLSRGMINQYPVEDPSNTINGTTLGMSCEIFPGSSGSPIVDINGDVVGVACATYPGAQLSFGVPAGIIAVPVVRSWLTK